MWKVIVAQLFWSVTAVALAILAVKFLPFPVSPKSNLVRITILVLSGIVALLGFVMYWLGDYFAAGDTHRDQLIYESLYLAYFACIIIAWVALG